MTGTPPTAEQEELYTVLGVDRTASNEDIKKAWKLQGIHLLCVSQIDPN